MLGLAIAGVFVAAPLFGGARIARPTVPRKGNAVDASTATIAVGALLVMCLVVERVLPLARELLSGSSGELTVDLPRFAAQQRPPFSRNVLLESFTSMVSPVNELYRPDVSNDLTYSSLTSLVNWLVIGGAFGTAAWAAVGSAQRRLGAAAATVMVLSGPIVAGVMWLSGGLYFALPSRYGLAMMPALAVTLALSLRSRLLIAVVGAIAVTQFVLFAIRTLVLG